MDEDTLRHLLGDQRFERLQMQSIAEHDQEAAKRTSPPGMAAMQIMGAMHVILYENNVEDLMLACDTGYTLAQSLYLHDPDLFGQLLTEDTAAHRNCQAVPVVALARALRILLGLPPKKDDPS